MGFQFQYGSIKRREGMKRWEPDQGFNSNMVRLKDPANKLHWYIFGLFQFQYGSIKSERYTSA